MGKGCERKFDSGEFGDEREGCQRWKQPEMDRGADRLPDNGQEGRVREAYRCVGSCRNGYVGWSPIRGREATQMDRVGAALLGTVPYGLAFIVCCLARSG